VTHRAGIHPMAFFKSCSRVFSSCRNKLLVPSKKLALCIGVNDYELQPLIHAVRDAKNLAQALSERGFDSYLLRNPNREEVLAASGDFAKERISGDLGVVYFSGHGLEYLQRNFLELLSPKSLKGKDPSILELQFLFKIWTGEIYGRTNLTTVVIFDSCRIDPRMGAKSLATFSPFISPVSPNSAYIAYASEPGRPALDGVFAPCIIKEFKHNDDPIVHDFFMNVREATITSTTTEFDGPQIPWSAECLRCRTFFGKKVDDSQKGKFIDLPTEKTKQVEEEAKKKEL